MSGRTAPAGPEPPAVGQFDIDLARRQDFLESQNEELKRANLEIEDLHREYAELYDLAPYGYITINSKRLINRINQAAAEMLGFNRSHLKLMGLCHFIAPEYHESFYNALNAAAQTDAVESLELKILRKAYSHVWVMANIQAFRRSGENDRQWRITMADITRRVEAENTLKESEARFKHAVDGTNEGIWEWYNRTPQKVWLSARFYEILGYRPGEFELTPDLFDSWIHPDDLNAVRTALDRHLREGENYEIEFRIKTASGVYRWVKSAGKTWRDETGGIGGMAGSFQDVHHRVMARQYLKLSRDILELLNENQSLETTTRTVLSMLKRFTGMEAAGIRLKKGEDYPYYVMEGFSSRFIEAERYLCARAPDGEIVRDAQGNPYLECMCGAVISGRTDSSLPFFTPNGGFWSNCTTDLLASTTEADRRGKTRNRCNGEGYESVALVPIRFQKETIGLIQFNDRRKNMFTPEMIGFFENMAINVGNAIARRRIEAQVQRDAQIKQDLLHEINHRVTNNLTAITGLLALERRRAEKGLADTAAYRKIMEDLTCRVKSLAKVHHMLSECEWKPLELGKLAGQVIDTCLSLTPSRESVSVAIPPSPVQVTPKQAHHLALIINELTTNTVKYALNEHQQARIWVDIASDGKWIQFSFRDNGPGYSEETLNMKKFNVGLNLISRLTRRTLRGTMTLENNPGALAVIRFPKEKEEAR